MPDKMIKPSDELVTIEGTMHSVDVIGFFEHPDNFVFKWSEDPEEISRRIEKETLGAATPEQLFGTNDEVLKARDYLGRALWFQGVKWLPSDMEGDGLPFFGLFTVIFPNSDIRLLSCGARNVVLKAAKADANGWFPKWLKIVEVQVKNPVKGRSAPLDLVLADEPTFDSEGKEF
jgi:hypothetical protein